MDLFPAQEFYFERIRLYKCRSLNSFSIRSPCVTATHFQYGPRRDVDCVERQAPCLQLVGSCRSCVLLWQQAVPQTFAVRRLRHCAQLHLA